MMRKLAAFAAAVVVALATPLAAQDRVPRTYPENGVAERADPEKSAQLRAREQAAADAAQAACDTGDQAGCGLLGEAFMRGAGRPQNRPVAELLLRDACNAADANGCRWLGELFWTLPERAAREEGLIAFQRGCRLGSLDACESEAEAIETGAWDEPGDYAAADALRRAACEKGGTASCRTIAMAQLSDDHPQTESERARATLERLCSGGDMASCQILASAAADFRQPPSPYLRGILDSGCRAGDAAHCRDLGAAVFADGSGPPEGRSAALELLDRACMLASFHCNLAAAIRARPALSESCAAGSQTDCAALGELYADGNSLLSSPAEAAKLLGNSCEAGITRVCATAAQNLLYDLEAKSADDIARAQRRYMTACEAGDDMECDVLGRRLLQGDPFPQDRALGFALLEGACQRGSILTCEELEYIAGESADAPLLIADRRFSEPLNPEEEEQQRRQLAAASADDAAADRLRNCTSTAVVHAGVLYEDTICELRPRAIGGYRMLPGQAPWQALLWRPERLGRQNLTPGQRVLCGGALVREGWVLTAAHCLTDQKAPINGKDYRIRLGVFNPQADEGVSFPILRAIAHPAYDPRSYAFDIALIQYDPRAGTRGTATNAIARIRIDDLALDDRKIVAGSRVYSYGWGWTEAESSSSTDHLRGVRLLLTDKETCTRITRYRGEKLDAALCAGGPNREQVCYGDSGGPLIIYSDPGSLPTVIGVVSAGRKCGSTGEQSRFTRVAKVRSWIDQVMGSGR